MLLLLLLSGSEPQPLCRGSQQLRLQIRVLHPAWARSAGYPTSEKGAVPTPAWLHEAHVCLVARANMLMAWRNDEDGGATAQQLAEGRVVLGYVIVISHAVTTLILLLHGYTVLHSVWA
jgi:hypothetical protein